MTNKVYLLLQSCGVGMADFDYKQGAPGKSSPSQDHTKTRPPRVTQSQFFSSRVLQFVYLPILNTNTEYMLSKVVTLIKRLVKSKDSKVLYTTTYVSKCMDCL